MSMDGHGDSFVVTQLAAREETSRISGDRSMILDGRCHAEKKLEGRAQVASIIQLTKRNVHARSAFFE